MALGAAAILAAVRSHAQSLGLFEQVLGHEPKSAPAGGGLVAAIWVQDLRPIAAGSGLASTSARLEVSVRVYANLLQEPLDALDANILAAVDALMAAYSGDFELGGLVRNVDLLGAHGDPLSAAAGYLPQDSKWYRVMVITLPLLINDLWSQSP
jgi:hypothetical protein